MSSFESTLSCAPVSLAQHPLHASPAPVASAVPLFLIKVPAGFPSPAADYVEESLDLNTYLVRHKAASFYFTVEGDSMINAGILAGDRVLVDRSIEPRHGHIV